MNTKLLGIYLNDHLAASVGGVELAKRCRRNNRRTPLGDYLTQLIVELREEQRAVQGMLDRLRIMKSRPKQGAMWLAERVGRLKLNGQLTGYSPLSRVVELEGLVAGINAKQCMWRSLKEIGNDELIDPAKLEALNKQAGKQVRKVEEFRKAAAATAFSG